ncbi:hypothetical protein N836_01150 [Leptolyngbya sp. Heron Island J]|uniref:hypothetical protein n=1 Tax=Leptolyngbya sp. Heron Island J TaxID=1385935 RepID=UPI0003B9F7C6|nr:hypothetical protein [Leptolyngbya sp. Heron Island J]ESA35199.1 hypothetical protein N836_01150 [Leptolyngbya sp. Heron Island J]
MTIFQSPQRVAIALRDNTLSEREKLNFLWVSIAIASIFGQASILGALAQPNIYGLVQLVPWGVEIWGIVVSYRANCRGDNQHFLERFVCLTTSLAIRAFLVYFVLTALIRSLSSLIYLPQLYSLQFLLTQLIVIGMFLYIYLHLKQLIAIAASSDGAGQRETGNGGE